MTNETLTAEPFLSGLYFGECPRWHDGRLWYSDFFDHAVSSVSPDGERRVEVDFDGEPGGLGWLPDGRLLFTSRLDRVIMRREPDHSLVVHGDLTALGRLARQRHGGRGQRPGLRRELRFDLDGLYAGTLQASDIATASVVRVDPDGTSSEAATDIQFPNGTVITDDGRTLIIAETLGGRLTAFDRAEDGAFSNRRVWAMTEGVFPDGICLCEDGTVWAANAMLPECVRFAEGGEVLERVTTSMPCFACMLGDDDRRTLYLVIAADSDGNKAPLARNGAIEKVRTSVPGAGLP